MFKQTSSAASAASVNECLALMRALDSEHLTLSFDERIEVTIFGFEKQSCYRDYPSTILKLRASSAVTSQTTIA
jgi:hypothetical protein